MWGGKVLIDRSAGLHDGSDAQGRRGERAHNMQMRGRRDLARLNKQQGRGFSLVHNLSLKSLQESKRRRPELPSTKQHSAKVQLAAGGIVQVKNRVAFLCTIPVV